MKDKIKLSANVLFSGIGCQERGILNTDLFDLQVNCTSDIYKEAVVSYAVIHCGLTNEMIENCKNYPSREQMAQELTDINLGYIPEKDKHYDWFKLAKRKKKDLEKFWLANKLSKNLGDINKIEKLPYADFWTCSAPCTDISICGKMKGLSPNSGTRSSLLWQQIRLLKMAKENGTLPKYILFENVKNLVSKKFINDFNSLLEILDEIGFNTYWKVLNAKNCGVPQNRKRVFVVCIRKDIDFGKFEFPKSFNSGLRLRDLLEKDVDVKYFLNNTIQERLQISGKTLTKDVIGTTKPTFRSIGQRDLGYNPKGIIGALLTSDRKQPKQILVQKQTAHRKNLEKQYSKFIEDSDGECCGVNCNNSAKFGYKPPLKGVSRTITTQGKNGVVENYAVRKLTPTECLKLMGFNDDDCCKLKSIGMSDTQLYKQAGNGIVTNCIKLIFEHLYKAMYDENYVCEDEMYINEDNINNKCIQAGNLSGGKMG